MGVRHVAMVTVQVRDFDGMVAWYRLRRVAALRRGAFRAGAAARAGMRITDVVWIGDMSVDRCWYEYDCGAGAMAGTGAGVVDKGPGKVGAGAGAIAVGEGFVVWSGALEVGDGDRVDEGVGEGDGVGDSDGVGVGVGWDRVGVGLGAAGEGFADAGVAGEPAAAGALASSGTS